MGVIGQLKDCYCKLATRVDALEDRTDLDEQTLAVDCDTATLGISNGNSVPLGELGNRTIYRYAPATSGLRVRWWDSAAGPHLDPLEWQGPADTNGFPLPTAAAPDFDLVSTSGNITDSGTTGDGAMRYGIIEGWIFLPDDVTHIREVNGNSGELGMVLAGSCCGDGLTELPGGNHTSDTTAGAGSGLLDSTPIGPGWHYIYNPQSDLSVFQGLQLQYSTDNEATWTAQTANQVEAPTVEVVEVLACEPVPEGWQIEPLAECCQPTYSAGGGGLDEAAVQALIDAQDHDDPQPATTLPIADNETDTAIRTGLVGTSLDYARADHNHPIRRQGNPGDITLAVGGSATLLQATVILDRWSTEETYEFNTRTRISIPDGIGWGYLTVPTIAGFQQPQIFVDSYRSDSGVPQNDGNPAGNSQAGAAPRGPLMGQEVHHWSSTNRLYIAYYRRDNAITSLYVNAVVRYIRL